MLPYHGNMLSTSNGTHAKQSVPVQTMKSNGEVRYRSTNVLGGSELSTSHPDYFTPGGGNPVPTE